MKDGNFLNSLLLVGLLSACSNVTVTSDVTVTLTPTPAATISHTSLPSTTTPTPALSPFPASLADFEKNKLQFATCFNSPDAAGACAPYDAALSKRLESFSWFPKTGTASEQYAAMSEHNSGEYLALSTDQWLSLVSVDGYVDRGPISETIDGKFYGFEGLLKISGTGKTYFELNTTDPSRIAKYIQLFGNTDVKIPFNFLATPPSGLLGDIVLLPGGNENYAIATIQMPDGTFISAVVVNFKDGVRYEMYDKGTYLLDTSGPEYSSISFTTRIVSSKGQINITPEILKWLLDQDAYVQVQTSKNFMRAAKEATQFTIEDSMWDALLKQFPNAVHAFNPLQEDLAALLEVFN